MKKTVQSRWMQEATMELLEMTGFSTMGAVLKYGDKVLVVGIDVPGYHAAVYEFIETPGDTGLRDIECRLNLLEAATDSFEDGGHAMAWCMEHV